jgi:ribosomal protein L13E
MVHDINKHIVHHNNRNKITRAQAKDAKETKLVTLPMQIIVQTKYFSPFGIKMPKREGVSYSSH